MIPFNRIFPLIAICFLISFTAAAGDNARTYEVVKNNGSVSHYRLLPVHFDPFHAQSVQKRVFSSFFLDTSLPAKYRIPAKLLPPVRDQGMRGTCAYFATVGLLEAYYLAQSWTHKSPTLSEECLVDVRNWMFDQGSDYTNDDKPTVRPDPDGDLPKSIIKTITRNGVPESAQYGAVDCRYDGSNTAGSALSLTDYLSTFTTDKKPSFPYGKGLKFDENTAPNIEAVKALISKNIPVEVGVLVYSEYLYGIDWRYNPEQDTDENLQGGHAITLTGYFPDSETGETIFTFKNSWNSDWGLDGYGTVNAALLTKSWSYDPDLDFIVSVHK